MNPDAPLGVFDSGLGGLTVVRALREALPREEIVYLGDTARVPYGTKGAATVIRYALACARHLVARDVKAIVIACNTVSAVAPDRLRIELDLPVLGVVEPGARAAVAATRTGRIGVLATTGTIASGAYPRAVAQISTRAEVIGQPAPLLVPLAEEGWTTGDVPRLAVRRYVEPLARAGVDVVVLGCTHYPLLREIIAEEVHARIGPDVRVVDSADATAAEVGAFLSSRGLARVHAGTGPAVQLLVTDVPGAFRDVARRFLGDEVDTVQQVDL
ncbi:MAG: glutamate racemase [Polyangiaceae bacterium]